MSGSKVRIRLSNLSGNTPLTVRPVRAALHARGADPVAGSDHALLFEGTPHVTLTTGDSLLSDPVKMN
ncbi:hypothetical protein FPJ27_15220 [Burkholderia sp. MS455]|uniref:hypothetical protein n=1 Tax=Burkholderia sp. MS455 TaxID=2811788 RepID=UPI001959A2E1|nr:hypothetical protein [Burkholderia sp. MS455]QRR07620.1 hypothetical protein FPJ27_15220 [Burkholderia sp. MS455]